MPTFVMDSARSFASGTVTSSTRTYCSRSVVRSNRNSRRTCCHRATAPRGATSCYGQMNAYPPGAQECQDGNQMRRRVTSLLIASRQSCVYACVCMLGKIRTAVHVVTDGEQARKRSRQRGAFMDLSAGLFNNLRDDHSNSKVVRKRYWGWADDIL